MPLSLSGSIGYDELRDAAKAAVEASGQTQGAVAGGLDVTPSALSQALNGSGARFALLQRRVVEMLTDFHVGDGIVSFPVTKKAE